MAGVVATGKGEGGEGGAAGAAGCRALSELRIALPRGSKIVVHGGQFHVQRSAWDAAASRAHLSAALEELVFEPHAERNRRAEEQRARRGGRWGGRGSSAAMSTPAKKYAAHRLTSVVVSVPAPWGLCVLGPANADRSTDGRALRPELRLDPRFRMRDSRLFPQREAFEAVTAYWDAHVPLGAGSCMMVMPTGSGKTRTSVWLAEHTRRRTAWLVHITKLALQVRAALREMLPGARVVIVQGAESWDDPVAAESLRDADFAVYVLGTLISAEKRLGPVEAARRLQTGDFGVVIGDEAHKFAAAAFMRCTHLFNARRRLFMTATPDRDDGLVRELRFLAGPVAFRAMETTGRLHVLGVTVPTARVPPLTRFGDIDYARLATAVATDPARNRWLARVQTGLMCLGRTTWICTVRADMQLQLLLAALTAQLRIRPLPRRTVGCWFKRSPALLAWSAARASVLRDTDVAAHPHLWRHSAATTSATCPAEAPLIAVFAGQPVARVPEYARWHGDSRVVIVPPSGPKASVAAATRAATHARVVLAFQTQLSDGFDMPWLDTVLVSGGFGTSVSVQQSVNRATRRFASGRKQFPLVLEVADDMPGSRVMVRCQAKRVRVMVRALGAFSSKVTLPANCFDEEGSDVDVDADARAAADAPPDGTSSARDLAQRAHRDAQDSVARAAAHGLEQDRAWAEARAARTGDAAYLLGID